MDLRKVRENLGRIKIYYLKGESQRALGAAMVALKDLARMGTLPVELRSMLREGVQYLARDEALKKYAKTPITYQPGQEKQLLVQLAVMYKEMEESLRRESHAQTMERKRKLDQAVNLGQKLLAQAKVPEADEAFQLAITHYRDEHRIFLLLGRWLLEAGHARRATPYLKKAAELEPENEQALELYGLSLRAKEEAGR